MRWLAPVVLLLVLWVPAAGAWTWPVSGPVLQGFSFDRAHPYAGGQHRGIDIGADAAGRPVLAPAAGVVSFAGTVPSSGKSVTIETPDGLAVTLTNLGSISVAKGDAVAEGAAVGTVGPSGTPEVAGPYLHLGIRTAADPQGYLDPLAFLPVAAAPAPAPAPAPAAAPAVAAPPVQADPPVAAPPAEAAPQPTAAGGAAPAVEPAAAGQPAPSVPRVGEAAPALEPRPVQPAAAPPVQTPAPTEVTAASLPALAASSLVVQAAPLAAGAGIAAAVPAAPRLVTSNGRGPISAKLPVRPVPAPFASVPPRSHVRPSVAPVTLRPAPPTVVHRRSHPHVPAFLLGLLALAAGTALGAARMISSRSPSLEGTNADAVAPEDPRRTRLAVRERAEAHRPRGRVRRAGGHLRALPAAAGERRPHGEWDGRARHAGDGRGRPERRLAA